MPVVDTAGFRRMLRHAFDNGYAFPSVNIVSSSSANAVLRGLSDANSDGIVSVGLGGARFAAGRNQRPDVGAAALAEFVHEVALDYPINVALHTDHCPTDGLDTFVRPLLERTRRRRERGQPSLFQSHMYDGSHLPLQENLRWSKGLLTECTHADVVLEIEIGLVGGEEDDIDNRGVDQAKLYTTPSDMVAVAEALGCDEGSRVMVAAAFGNAHGIHPPGDFELDPSVLARGQAAVAAAHGEARRLLLVFHGGSGSSPKDIANAISHGVVKMNIDTDTQHAYSIGITDHVEEFGSRMRGTDDELPDKTVFEQRAFLDRAEAAMAARVEHACVTLGSAGRSSSWTAA